MVLLASANLFVEGRPFGTRFVSRSIASKQLQSLPASAIDAVPPSRGLSIKFMFSVATVYSARTLTIFVSQTAGTKVHFLMSSTGQQFGLQRSIGLERGRRKGRKGERERERERNHEEAALEKMRGS